MPNPNVRASVELPNDQEARRLAERLAEKLATSKTARWETIIVTDESGNVVCEMAVPLRH
jgi:hypothetical protein